MFKDPKMERFGRAATRGRRAASHATPRLEFVLHPLNYQLLENSTCGDDVNVSRVSYTSGDGRAREQAVHARGLHTEAEIRGISACARSLTSLSPSPSASPS